MSEWKEYKLGEICSRLSSGKSIKSDSIYTQGEYPVWGGNGIRGYTNIKNFSGRCCIIGRQGAYCGNVHFFDGDAYMTEHAIVAVGNNLADSYFLACQLSLMHLENLSAQSAQPGISVKTLSTQTICLPSIEEQKRIVGILTSLDDKIDLLRRENSTLEAMAETLFRQWFVVEAKEKWEEGKLGDICNYVTEKIDIGNVETSDYISTENMCSNKQGVVQASSVPKDGKATKYRIDDVLLSNIRPYFKKIWLSDRDGGCSADVLCIRGKNERYAFFSYYTIRQDEFFDYVMLGSKGCKMPRGDKSHIMNWPIIIPPKDELLKFNEIAKQGITKIRNNNKQIQTLIQTRDGLLPRLMSGEVKFQ